MRPHPHRNVSNLRRKNPTDYQYQPSALPLRHRALLLAVYWGGQISSNQPCMWPDEGMCVFVTIEITMTLHLLIASEADNSRFCKPLALAMCTDIGS